MTGPGVTKRVFSGTGGWGLLLLGLFMVIVGAVEIHDRSTPPPAPYFDPSSAPSLAAFDSSVKTCSPKVVPSDSNLVIADSTYSESFSAFVGSGIAIPYADITPIGGVGAGPEFSPPGILCHLRSTPGTLSDLEYHALRPGTVYIYFPNSLSTIPAIAKLSVFPGPPPMSVGTLALVLSGVGILIAGLIVLLLTLRHRRGQKRINKASGIVRADMAHRG